MIDPPPDSRIAATAAREEAAELKGEAERLRAKLDASDAAANQLRGDAQAARERERATRRRAAR
mgnify:CR=1 FL=1